MIAVFDTLEYAKRLKEAGFSEHQAEVQVEVLKEFGNSQFMTKQDIQDMDRKMESSMQTLDSKLENSIQTLDRKMERSLQELDRKVEHNIQELERKLGKDIQVLDKKVGKLEDQVSRMDWKLNALITLFGIAVVLMGFLKVSA